MESKTIGHKCDLCEGYNVHFESPLRTVEFISGIIFKLIIVIVMEIVQDVGEYTLTHTFLVKISYPESRLKSTVQYEAGAFWWLS